MSMYMHELLDDLHGPMRDVLLPEAGEVFACAYCSEGYPPLSGWHPLPDGGRERCTRNWYP